MRPVTSTEVYLRTKLLIDPAWLFVVVEKRVVDRVNLEPIDAFLRESLDIVSGKFEMPVC